MDAFLDLLVGGAGLDLWGFLLLCGVSFAGSLIAAAMGLGGGTLMLVTMALFLPPAVLIPVHGVVQFGSNFGRTVLMVRDVLSSIIPVFLIGTILGAVIGGHLVINLPTSLLQAILAFFILYATWAPKFQASSSGKRTFFGVGTIGAFVTMFVGATGPLIAPFVAAASKERQQVVADPRHADGDPTWVQNNRIRATWLCLWSLHPTSGWVARFWVRRDLVRKARAKPSSRADISRRAEDHFDFAFLTPPL